MWDTLHLSALYTHRPCLASSTISDIKTYVQISWRVDLKLFLLSCWWWRHLASFEPEIGLKCVLGEQQGFSHVLESFFTSLKNAGNRKTSWLIVINFTMLMRKVFWEKALTLLGADLPKMGGFVIDPTYWVITSSSLIRLKNWKTFL